MLLGKDGATKNNSISSKDKHLNETVNLNETWTLKKDNDSYKVEMTKL